MPLIVAGGEGREQTRLAKAAKANQVAAGGDRKSPAAKSVSANSPKVIDTRKEVAKLAGVSEGTIGA